MGRARDLARYSATRLALAPLMLWLIASLVFLLLRVAPGDPVDAVLGSRAPAAAKAAMRARLGLDQSLLDQYLSYLNGLIHGDLGQALINQEPVRTIIGRTLPASLELSVIALVLAAVVGLSIGFSGIARPEGKIDLGGRLYGLGTYALPPFWVAMLVQLVFAQVNLSLGPGNAAEANAQPHHSSQRQGDHAQLQAGGQGFADDGSNRLLVDQGLPPDRRGSSR